MALHRCDTRVGKLTFAQGFAAVLQHIRRRLLWLLHRPFISTRDYWPVWIARTCIVARPVAILHRVPGFG
jgi:hypothetical protein